MLALALLLLAAGPQAAAPYPIRVEPLVRETPDGPVRAWLARVDLTDPRVSFVVTAPPERREGDPAGTEAHLLATDAWAEREGVDLAVNGGFFARLDGAPETARGWTEDMPVDIVGLSRSDGRTVSPPRSAAEPEPALLVDETRGGRSCPCTVRPALATERDLAGIEDALGGMGPRNGQPSTLLVESGENRGATAQVAPAQRHPRTAAGVTKDGRTLLLLVVDGRRPGWSIGATLPELAALLVEAGAWSAINLDGGGSSAMWQRAPGRAGGVLNKPSDGRVRPAANHLGVRVEGGPTAPAPVDAPAYRLEQVTDGVYCAIARETAYYVSNSVVIVGREAVLVVDSGATPSGARGLVEAVRTVTPLPIRYLVDTHFHFDHALGNGAFGPETLILAHDATRALLAPDQALQGRTYRGYVDGLPAAISRAREQAQAEPDPARASAATARAASLDAYRQELATLVTVAPRLAFPERATIDLGGREVELHFLGRGHTAGDLVVLLPRERVVATGDLFNGYLGFMGDAYVDEWAAALDRLARLDFETVIPGHGPPFRGKEKIAPVQACLKDLWAQAVALERSGVPADEAAPRIDLRAHAASFPSLGERGFNPVAVRRVYEVIAERRASASR